MGTSCIDIIIIHVKRPHDHAIACLLVLVYVSIRYIRTPYTSHIVFVVLTHMYIFIMPRALLSYKKCAHVHMCVIIYARINRMEVPEWKKRMEK